MLLTLQSGAQVRVPLADVATVDSVAAQDCPERHKPTVPADLGMAESVLRSTCQGRWAVNDPGYVDCVVRQREAVNALRARTMSTQARGAIRRTCAERWPNDFEARNGCEEARLGRLPRLDDTQRRVP